MMRFVSPRRSVWITLGGGLEPAEDPVDGLHRELEEETLRSGWSVGPELWTRSVTFELDEEVIEQHERYFLVHTAHFEPPPDMPDEIERRWFGGFRWWSASEIQASAERFAPIRLGMLLDELVRNGPPDSPVDVGR